MDSKDEKVDFSSKDIVLSRSVMRSFSVSYHAVCVTRAFLVDPRFFCHLRIVTVTQQSELL